jgi:glucose dehydrogenase
MQHGISRTYYECTVRRVRNDTSHRESTGRVSSGKLKKWYYQFSPHDLWDWDATETSVMVNADWQGSRRQLMLHANRNGFFYVFDRSNGKLLLASAECCV